MRGFLVTLRERGHALVVDAYVLEEARRNLEAKFPGALADFEAMLTTLEIAAKVAPSLPEELVPGLPWKDRPVLAAAIFLRCQFLLTGDKPHFGPLCGQAIEGVVVESPAGLAAKLE